VLLTNLLRFDSSSSNNLVRMDWYILAMAKGLKYFGSVVKIWCFNTLTDR
jgi:hypothetical protein